jgi:hypothetical protein
MGPPHPAVARCRSHRRDRRLSPAVKPHVAAAEVRGRHPDRLLHLRSAPVDAAHTSRELAAYDGRVHGAILRMPRLRGVNCVLCPSWCSGCCRHGCKVIIRSYGNFPRLHCDVLRQRFGLQWRCPAAQTVGSERLALPGPTGGCGSFRTQSHSQDLRANRWRKPRRKATSRGNS